MTSIYDKYEIEYKKAISEQIILKKQLKELVNRKVVSLCGVRAHKERIKELQHVIDNYECEGFGYD